MGNTLGSINKFTGEISKESDENKANYSHLKSEQFFSGHLIYASVCYIKFLLVGILIHCDSKFDEIEIRNLVDLRGMGDVFVRSGRVKKNMFYIFGFLMKLSGEYQII